MAGDGKRDWVDVIAKLLIPVAIFVIGQQVSCQRDASDREQRRFDRNASLLKSLASKDENEKLITLATINYLIERDDFPPELLSAVAAVASGDRSAPSTQTAQLTLEKAAKNEGLTAQVQTASMNVPTRVYIQIAAEDQRARAAKLQLALQNAGFIAPGIELRKDNSPNNTDIRYFSNDIKKQADQVKEEVLKQHFVVTKDPSNRDNGKVHLNQIEVWIGKDENAGSTLELIPSLWRDRRHSLSGHSLITLGTQMSEVPLMNTLEAAVALSLKNILLATDFSPGSETAVKYAQAIARRHSSCVHTIHVNSPDSYNLLDPDAFAITFNGPEANSKNVADVLHGLLTGLPSQTPLRQGAVWEVISDVVRRNEIDLLVLASHGRHGIPRLVLGSVAEEVFRNVSCPVLTVGPDVKPCNSREMKIKKVLLATHFEAGSTAPTHAALLCNEFGAELTILHVADENKVGSNGRNGRDLAQQLNSVVPPEAGLWRKPECVIKYGLPSANILETAEQIHADLIVLGARHPEPAKIVSHLPWATAARVIAEAECPVLTVRQKDSYEL